MNCFTISDWWLISNNSAYVPLLTHVFSHNCLTLFPEAIFSERELKFMFAICHRPSVCRLSVVCLSSVVCNVGAPYSGD